MRTTSRFATLALIIALQQDVVISFSPSKNIISTRHQQQSSPRTVVFLDLEDNSNDDSANTEKPVMIKNDHDEVEKKSLIPENSLVLPTAFLGFVAVATQAGAYSDFFSSLSQMKDNMAADPTDFWPAVNFWIFFAAGHAILQPIFWISEVLHASPGPLVGDLVPVSFIVGNVVAIAAFTFVKEVRLLLVVFNKRLILLRNKTQALFESLMNWLA